MTDERSWTLPGADTDEVDPTDQPRRDRDPADSRPPPDENESEKEVDPLLREGPDAPDAADIEDPDEQL
jgi:hypothetical protein